MANASTIIQNIIETIGQHKGAEIVPMDEPGYFGWSVWWFNDKGDEESLQFRVEISAQTSMDLFQRAVFIEDRNLFTKILHRAGSLLWHE